MNIMKILVKRKDYLFSFILSFLLGTICGYFIRGLFSVELTPFLQGIFTGTFLVGVVFEVLPLLIAQYNKKQEDKRLALKSLIKHTDEDLIPALRKFAKNPLDSSVESISLQTKKHVKSGYKEELWTLFEGSNGIRETSTRYFDLEKKIPTQIEAFVKKSIPQNLKIPDWELGWFVKDIKDSIELKLNDNIMKTFRVIESYTVDAPTERIRYFLIFGESGKIDRTYQCEYLTEENKKEVSDILNNISNDAELQGTIKTLHDLKQLYGDKRENFEKRMDVIIDNIEHTTNEKEKIVLGKCDWCKISKEKWKID